MAVWPFTLPIHRSVHRVGSRVSKSARHPTQGLRPRPEPELWLCGDSAVSVSGLATGLGLDDPGVAQLIPVGLRSGANQASRAGSSGQCKTLWNVLAAEWCAAPLRVRPGLLRLLWLSSCISARKEAENCYHPASSIPRACGSDLPLSQPVLQSTRWMGIRGETKIGSFHLPLLPLTHFVALKKSPAA